MNVTGKTRLFRKDFHGKPAYSRRIASKEYKDGHTTDQWIGVYEPVQMPKDTDLPDKADINITKAFEAVYKDHNGEIKRKLVVQEYEYEFEAVEEPTPWA